MHMEHAPLYACELASENRADKAAMETKHPWNAGKVLLET